MLPMNDPVKNRKGVCRVLRWLLRHTERLLAVIGLMSVVYWTCFDYSCIISNSMKPTLRGTGFDNGDRVLTERVSYCFREPCRWEVVTIRHPDGGQIMKRVVGLPGETIQMTREGKLIIDGNDIQPPSELTFLHYFPYGNLTAGKTSSCGEGFYVLGDDSRDSDDSRFNGPIHRESIIGRAWLILWPSDRRGLVSH
jgi:signal peptidase I